MSVTAGMPRRQRLSVTRNHSHGPLGYLEMGNPAGAPVVFLHGFGADLLAWSLCLSPLSRGYRLIALDLPGHGRSCAEVGTATFDFMTEWLAEALDLLGVARACLVGHSMGGRIALDFALRHRERVNGLALLAPAALAGQGDDDTLTTLMCAPSLEHAEAFAGRLIGPDGASLVPALARAMVDALADPERLRAQRKLLWQRQAVENGPPSPEAVARLNCPTLILWGLQDRISPMPDLKAFPSGTHFASFERAGHLPHIETPSEVVQALKGFLAAVVP